MTQTKIATVGAVATDNTRPCFSKAFVVAMQSFLLRQALRLQFIASMIGGK
ncbi:MAG: hypothetical protein V4805_15240 [Pseudomonadota bacterium]